MGFGWRYLSHLTSAPTPWWTTVLTGGQLDEPMFSIYLARFVLSKTRQHSFFCRPDPLSREVLAADGGLAENGGSLALG